MSELERTVDELMPQLVADLKRLTAIPSIAFDGFDKTRVIEAHDSSWLCSPCHNHLSLPTSPLSSPPPPLSTPSALRTLGTGRPPVTLTIVFEGQEEWGSPFDSYPAEHPELFACDAMVIADMGNIEPGVPTFTTALRGTADVHT